MLSVARLLRAALPQYCRNVTVGRLPPQTSSSTCRVFANSANFANFAIIAIIAIRYASDPDHLEPGARAAVQ